MNYIIYSGQFEKGTQEQQEFSANYWALKMFNTNLIFTEYYPPWEPPVSRLRATRKRYFPPSEPPLHIVAAHIFDFTINLLIVVIGELHLQ